MQVFSSLLELNHYHHHHCLCKLKPLATQPVLGSGNSQSDIVFIGEAPGKAEDLEGTPFIGRSGKFLSEMLRSIKLSREDVYITNIVKYRPPNNRDPLLSEKKDCLAWLIDELYFVKPKIIIPLGRHALNTFIPEAKISKNHGFLIKKEVVFTIADKKYFVPTCLYFPLYHPAAALYNGKLKETLLRDMQKMINTITAIKNHKKPTL